MKNLLTAFLISYFVALGLDVADSESYSVVLVCQILA